MPLQGLHHFTIRAADLEATRAFYVDVLGLEIGARPPFDFPGYWLYSAGSPTVHLVGPRARDAGRPREPGETGLLDHVAFNATGLAAMQERLRRLAIAHEERLVPRDGQTQIFLRDPNGISVELNYPMDDGLA